MMQKVTPKWNDAENDVRMEGCEKKSKKGKMQKVMRKWKDAEEKVAEMDGCPK